MTVQIILFCTSGSGDMGIFGGNSSRNQQQSASDEIIRKQFNQTQQELEQKRKALYSERLDIIKAQGGQTWHGNR